MVSVIDRMTPDEFEVFVAKSMKLMSRSIAKCNHEWNFPSYRQWWLSDDVLTLFDGPLPLIRCQVQIVGDYRTSHNFWRWSWCFIDFREKTIRDMALVKAFGHQHRITDITLEGMQCGEGAGWELSAVAANLLGAKSVFAAVERSRTLFLLIKSVQFDSAVKSDCGEPQKGRPTGSITGANATTART